MSAATLEHANITVRDPARTANMLCRVLGWKVRWQGPAKNGGHSIHVGSKKHYLAVYSATDQNEKPTGNSSFVGELNHIGIVVDDIQDAERRVIAAGYRPHNHGDYEPGRRFYFHDHDNIEFEIVSYQKDSKFLSWTSNLLWSLFK